MFFSSATVPSNPDGPNEDWAAATSDLIVVLDGATVRTDTGCNHSVAWYARKLGAGIIAAAASRSNPLSNVLADAIREVAALHPECQLDHPGTPSAATAIVRVEGDFLRYLVLGDVTVVAETDGGIVAVSDDRVSHTASAERAESDRYPIGAPEKQAALVRMKHAELAARNQPDGYWIAAADPSVVQHALVGEIKSSQVKRLAVLTDGVARTVTLFQRHSWETALDVLEDAGPEELIRQVRAQEAADPHGEVHRRNKRSDDATVVFAALAPLRWRNRPRVVNRGPATKQERAQALERALQDPVLKAQGSADLMGAEPRMPGWRKRRT